MIWVDFYLPVVIEAVTIPKGTVDVVDIVVNLAGEIDHVGILIPAKPVPDIGIGDIDFTTSRLLELGGIEKPIVEDRVRRFGQDVPIAVLPIYGGN